ncbi:MAG: vWA domain-containing protein [Planctomycetaceae bacterium]
MLDETQYDDSDDFEVESQNDASHWDHANAWNGEILPEEEPVLLELAVDDDGIPPADSSWIGGIAGAGLSIVFHLWLIFTLSGITFNDGDMIEMEPIETVFSNPPPPEPAVEVPEYELANPDDRETEVRKAVNARSVGLELTHKPTPEAAPVHLMEVSPELKALPKYDIPQGMELSKTVVVPGTTGEGLVQLDSALDRVTWEIARNLQERKVLVVWMIDGSGSIVPQRQTLVKRLQRIYGELGALDKAGQLPRMEQPLISGVVTFGAQTTFMTKEPTDKFDDIVNAIQAAPVDPSGVENVFTAVNKVMDDWHKYRTDNGRRIMLVVLTDEAGDDHGPPLEFAINKCQRHGAKAYVIGPAAPFGRRKGYIPYVAKENGRTYQIPIDLGPESVVVENVDLPYWYEGPQLTYLSSGFGPYALNRLVKETGGVYFMTNMTTNSELSTIGQFDSAMMKAYEPDYRFGSPDQFMKDIMQHPLRAAVVGMAEYSQTTNLRAQGTPTLEFRVQANNFRQQFADAQKSAAISSLAIDSILAKMPPNTEKLYSSEQSLRWRLAFSLDYGRLLAQKVRAFEYNSALAQLKGTYTDSDINSKVNHFIFRPDKELNYAPSLKKQAKIAEEHLQRVIKEAPGTPWEMMAKRELKDGFGIRLVERFIPPPPPTPKADPAKAKPGPKLLPEQQKQQPKKPAPKPVEPVLPKL